MLAMFLPFVVSFLPEILKWWNAREANRHELAMMEMRLKYAEKEHLWKMEEINVSADIKEAELLHAPQASFGVQVLDAAKGHKMSSWTIVPVFWAFAFLDWLSGIVRPAVTFAAFGFYMAYKIACLMVMQHTVENPQEWYYQVSALWGEQDWDLLSMCLSFYFGLRARKEIFGGNAANNHAGK